MTCKVHDAIIAKGFRETRSIVGSAAKYGKRQTCYIRGEYEVRYTDYGPNEYQPHAPDSNRYVMQLFCGGKKIHGGTAWYAILNGVPEL
jgi:hypothetical protein